MMIIFAQKILLKSFELEKLFNSVFYFQAAVPLKNSYSEIFLLKSENLTSFFIPRNFTGAFNWPFYFFCYLLVT